MPARGVRPFRSMLRSRPVFERQACRRSGRRGASPARGREVWCEPDPRAATACYALRIGSRCRMRVRMGRPATGLGGGARRARASSRPGGGPGTCPPSGPLETQLVSCRSIFCAYNNRKVLSSPLAVAAAPAETSTFRVGIIRALCSSTDTARRPRPAHGMR